MDNKTSSFDKVQYKEGYFVLIPNLISFIALFVVIIVFYSIFPQIAPQVIVTSFVIYSIIFHALYTARFYSVNSNYAKELFVKFTYEKLTLKTVFLKKLNSQLSEFIIILFFLYLYIAFGQTYLVTTISDIEINDEFNAFVELTSSAAFYVFLIPVIAVINILFYRFTLAIRFDYQYYFSLGCFKIIQKYYDIIDEAIPFFIQNGIHAYDSFLKRYTPYGMKNRDQVSSLIIAQPRNQLMLFLNDLIRSFSEENSLEPLRFLGEFIGMAKKDLLVLNNLSHKIKENSSIISIISATIFASLTFLIQLGIMPTLNGS